MKEKEKTVKNNAPTREMSMEEKSNDYVEKETFSDLIKYAKKGDRSGFLSTMDIYLNNKYDVNRRDSCLWNMLHHAAVNEGNLRIVDVLLKTKINLESINNNNQTALYISVNQGYFDITKKLIERGSSINCLDNEKNNVLHLCAAGDHFELMKYLLEKSPLYLLTEKNIYGKTPKDLAKEKIYSKIVDNERKAFKYLWNIRCQNSNI